MKPPHLYADDLVNYSEEFGRLSDELGQILELKPIEWLSFRHQEGVKSATEADRMWEATPRGIKEAVLKLKCKALEKKMSAIRTYLKLKSDEAHNVL